MKLQQFLEKIVKKYVEFKGIISESKFESENYMELDHHDEIIDEKSIKVKTVENKDEHVFDYGRIPEFAQSHFVFREANAAVKMLNETFERCPALKDSCKISYSSALGNIRLDIDLAFLNIPDSVMAMLDLDYDHRLVISLLIEENRVIESLDENQWTPELLRSLNIKVLQGGRMDSYGCSEYISSRAKKYRDEVYINLKSNNQIPSVLSMFRDRHDANSSSEAVSDYLQLMI